MKKENKNKYKCSVESEAVKRIRGKVGMTQAQVANALGVSLRAIQSYEQGWREVPTHIMIQLLVLAAAHHPAKAKREACWEITGCSLERQVKCPCRHTDGSLCWLVSGRKCAENVDSTANDIKKCLDCPVVNQFL